MKYDLKKAHEFCRNNKAQLQKDTLCGCFYCCRILTPDKITEWINDTSGTAICPYCGVDSIIGLYSGYPITHEFLNEMNDHWFGDES